MPKVHFSHSGFAFAVTALFYLGSTSFCTAADWKAAEQVKTYAVSGSTGAELYQSIGAKGPSAGVGLAIAHTTFTLTWRRDYQPRSGGCVLATARPSLTIIYTLPKASGKMSGTVASSWQTFIDGVEKHERVHGEHILSMVKKIEAFSVGLTELNDPKCQKVRATLQKRLGELSNEQRRLSSDFDRLEISDGGNVHRLVLALVNGP